jgi:hypothetical protein
VSREGQLSFFHDYLRSAIWREYLDEEHELESAHARLAEIVLRWQEPDAFGQSLKAYGFANGIHHLIAINCNNEATSLLLDENYRETATRTLHDSQPILKDVAYVRNANALADGIYLSQAAHLSVLALTGREQLTKHLREALDLAATEADWETVISVISAENNDEVSLLLACRALARNNAGISAKMTLELQPLMEKWATAGKSEWREIIQLIAIQKNE